MSFKTDLSFQSSGTFTFVEEIGRGGIGKESNHTDLHWVFKMFLKVFLYSFVPL